MRRAVFLVTALALVIAGIFWLTSGDESGGNAEVAKVETPAAPEPQETAPPAAPISPPGPRQTVENKVLESGVPVRVVRRERIITSTGPLYADYLRLDQEAKSGNSVSQYKLGLLLYECRDVPSDQAELAHDVEAIHQTRRHGGWDIDSPASEERELRHRYEQCDRIPAEARAQFRDWLKSAADAGVIEAEVNLPLKLPPADYCQFLSECSPQQRASQEALQSEAIDYLGRARDAGSVSALWTFGAWYAEGEVLPKNDIEAYAHFRALDQINAATGDSQRFGQMLASMKKRLRPVDLDQAEARAKELLSNPKCCVITP